jgi:hypothetical protein
MPVARLASVVMLSDAADVSFDATVSCVLQASSDSGMCRGGWDAIVFAALLTALHWHV